MLYTDNLFVLLKSNYTLNDQVSEKKDFILNSDETSKINKVSESILDYLFSVQIVCSRLVRYYYKCLRLSKKSILHVDLIKISQSVSLNTEVVVTSIADWLMLPAFFNV